MTLNHVEAAALHLPPEPLSDGVVCLRPWCSDDTDALVAACQDPRIQQFIAIPRPYRREHAEAYLERTRQEWATGSKAAFAVADAEDPSVLLGAIDAALFGATGNAAYWVAPDARGRGVAERSLRLLTDWAFSTLPLALMMLEIRPENVVSRHVAEAAGYHLVGHLDLNQATGDRDGLIYARFVVGAAPVPGGDVAPPAGGAPADLRARPAAPAAGRRLGWLGTPPLPHRR